MKNVTCNLRSICYPKKSNDVYQEIASESDYFYEIMNQLKEKYPVLTDLVLYALKMKKQYDDSTYESIQ